VSQDLKKVLMILGICPFNLHVMKEYFQIKICFLLFVHDSVFFGVVSHLTRDLCLFIKPYVFFLICKHVAVKSI